MRKLKLHSKISFFPILFILFLSFSRLIPHSPNFTPIIAAAIFSGYFFKNFYYSSLIIISSVFLSDLFLGFHNLTIFIYVSMMISVLIGHTVKHFKFIEIFYSGLVASICFFLITNFGAWIMLEVYEKNLNGLLSSYIMAIPFFKNTVISTLVYLIGIKIVFNFLINKKFKNHIKFFNNN